MDFDFTSFQLQYMQKVDALHGKRIPTSSQIDGTKSPLKMWTTTRLTLISRFAIFRKIVTDLAYLLVIQRLLLPTKYPTAQQPLMGNKVLKSRRSIEIEPGIFLDKQAQHRCIANVIP